MSRYTLTVTSKGQVTLPAEFRDRLGIVAGTKLALSVDESGEARLSKSRSIEDLAGSMAQIGAAIGRPFVQADIESAIGAAVAEREARAKGPAPR